MPVLSEGEVQLEFGGIFVFYSWSWKVLSNQFFVSSPVNCPPETLNQPFGTFLGGENRTFSKGEASVTDPDWVFSRMFY